MKTGIRSCTVKPKITHQGALSSSAPACHCDFTSLTVRATNYTHYNNGHAANCYCAHRRIRTYL